MENGTPEPSQGILLVHEGFELGAGLVVQLPIVIETRYKRCDGFVDQVQFSRELYSTLCAYIWGKLGKNINFPRVEGKNLPIIGENDINKIIEPADVK